MSDTDPFAAPDADDASPSIDELAAALDALAEAKASTGRGKMARIAEAQAEVDRLTELADG